MFENINLNIKLPWKKKDGEKRKTNLIEEAINNPENFLLIASIENEEIVIKIKKKEND